MNAFRKGRTVILLLGLLLLEREGKNRVGNLIWVVMRILVGVVLLLGEEEEEGRGMGTSHSPIWMSSSEAEASSHEHAAEKMREEGLLFVSMVAVKWSSEMSSALAVTDSVSAVWSRSSQLRPTATRGGAA